MIPRVPALGLILLPALLAACTGAPQRSSGDRAIAAACRQEVDRVYAAQNRRELSFRDQRDTPFASSYNSGVTSAGLGSLFGRDRDVQSCVGLNRPGATAGEAGTGPTFSPSAR